MSFAKLMVEAYKKFYSLKFDHKMLRIPLENNKIAVKYAKKLRAKGVKASADSLCSVVLSNEKYFKEVAQALVDEREVLHEYHVERLMARRREKKLAHYRTLLKANLISKEAYDVLDKSLGD